MELDKMYEDVEITIEGGGKVMLPSCDPEILQKIIECLAELHGTCNEKLNLQVKHGVKEY
tara:strand:- start:1575 stop:1754 length:180 start_codon:yes stop_codon:yes gene_type:complete